MVIMFTELKMNGMTIGKKMNIRVIRTNGQPISLSHSALRQELKQYFIPS